LFYQERELGNEAFERGAWDAALAHYRSADASSPACACVSGFSSRSPMQSQCDHVLHSHAASDGIAVHACCSRALELRPAEAALFSNRAAAYLAKGW
jgi:hypothetical protein